MLIAILNLQWIKGYSSPDEKPLIFPIPNDIQVTGGNFVIDKSTFIVLPEKPSKSDAFPCGFLIAEFSDKFEQPVLIKRSSFVSGMRNIYLWVIFQIRL